MDTNVVAVRPRQTLIHAADNHGVAQIGPPQPKFSPRITRMNAKKEFRKQKPGTGITDAGYSSIRNIRATELMGSAR